MKKDESEKKKGGKKEKERSQLEFVSNQ